MNLAAAYGNLTVDDLKRMLAAAKADHRQQMEETRSKWQAEVASTREAVAKSVATWTAELQAQKNANAVLKRDLDIVHADLAKANAVIVEQERKLRAHDEVTELERRLTAAKRIAS